MNSSMEVGIQFSKENGGAKGSLPSLLVDERKISHDSANMMDEMDKRENMHNKPSIQLIKELN